MSKNYNENGVLVLKAAVHSLVKFEQFMKGRKWGVNSFTDTREALSFLMDASVVPRFALVCLDQSMKQVGPWTGVLKMKYGITVIGYFEKDLLDQQNTLNRLGIAYSLPSSFSGPSFERLISRIRLEEKRAAERKQKEGRKDKKGEKEKPDEGVIRIRGAGRAKAQNADVVEKKKKRRLRGFEVLSPEEEKKKVPLIFTERQRGKLIGRKIQRPRKSPDDPRIEGDVDDSEAYEAHEEHASGDEFEAREGDRGDDSSTSAFDLFAEPEPEPRENESPAEFAERKAAWEERRANAEHDDAFDAFSELERSGDKGAPTQSEGATPSRKSEKGGSPENDLSPASVDAKRKRAAEAGSAEEPAAKARDEASGEAFYHDQKSKRKRDGDSAPASEPNADSKKKNERGSHPGMEVGADTSGPATNQVQGGEAKRELKKERDVDLLDIFGDALLPPGEEPPVRTTEPENAVSGVRAEPEAPRAEGLSAFDQLEQYDAKAEPHGPTALAPEAAKPQSPEERAAAELQAALDEGAELDGEVSLSQSESPAPGDSLDPSIEKSASESDPVEASEAEATPESKAESKAESKSEKQSGIRSRLSKLKAGLKSRLGLNKKDDGTSAASPETEMRDRDAEAAGSLAGLDPANASLAEPPSAASASGLANEEKASTPPAASEAGAANAASAAQAPSPRPRKFDDESFPELQALAQPVAAAQSFLAIATEHALSKVAANRANRNDIEAIGEQNQISCLVVAAEGISGFLVVAAGKGRRIDKAVLETMSHEIGQNLAAQVTVSNLGSFFDINLKTAHFAGWAKHTAEFVKTAALGAHEIAAAFFPCDSSMIEIILMTDYAYLGIGVDDIDAEHAIDFDLFLHLPINRRYLRYARKGRKLLDRQRERLVGRGVSHFYIKSEDAAEFLKYRAKVFLHKSHKAYVASVPNFPGMLKKVSGE